MRLSAYGKNEFRRGRYSEPVLPAKLDEQMTQGGAQRGEAATENWALLAEHHRDFTRPGEAVFSENH